MIIKLIKNNQKGFSLLELLIYIAILSVFLLVLTNLFFMVSTSSVREEVQAEVRQNLRFAGDQITGSVRSARSFCVDPNPDCITANSEEGNTLDVVSNNLVERFRVADGVLQKIQSTVGGTCAIADGCKADCFTFDSDCMIENITTDAVTVNVFNPIFTKVGNTIQINLKIDYNDKGRGDYKFSESVKMTASLRL